MLVPVRRDPSAQEYPLHRLVLSRSPYFRALMRGPWADAGASRLTLDFDDGLVDDAAVEARPPPNPDLTCTRVTRLIGVLLERG